MQCTVEETKFDWTFGLGQVLKNIWKEEPAQSSQPAKITTLRYEDDPEPGDLIEIFRGLYQHWAVYVGDGYVVHVAPTSNSSSSSNSLMSGPNEKAVVKEEKLLDVVGKNKWKINNSLDEKYFPLAIRIIVRTACAMVGKRLPYCVVRGNCEHFATEMRYGKPESRQVRNIVDRLF